VRVQQKQHMRTVPQLAPWDSQPGCRPTTSHAPISTPHSRTTRANSISNRHTRQTACRAACPSAAFAISNRHTRKIACCAGCPGIDHTISNRHLVQLKFAASSAESTTSLFLIVTKQHSFQTHRGITYRTGCARPIPATHRSTPEPLVAQACPACVRFPSNSEHATTISNRHLVRLEFAASPTESTSSLFLIDPNHPQLPTAPEAQ
jgi:hypothetical protein